jgi:putative membrane protein
MLGIAPTNSTSLPHRYFGALLAVIVVATLAWSAFHPFDWLTWWMEVSWVLVGLPIVVWLARRHGITRILLVLLTMHAVILVVGGHYTYEKVPVGLWVQEWFDLARNDYDRLGHFVQGFVPALIARELLRRTSPLQPGRWLAFLCITSALAFSAIFEMIEWGSSVALGASADAFLGSQGDPWDAQWDMLCALIGAMCSMATLSRLHERELRRMRCA